jgi:FkbM family methyltransferase
MSNKYTLPARVCWAVLSATRVPGPWLEPEMETLPWFVRPGQAAVDVGGNVGKYAALLSRLVGATGRVISFEPYSVSARWFEVTRRLVRGRNIELRRVALSIQSGRGFLALPRTASGAIDDPLVSLSYPGGSKGVSVEVSTLDEEMSRLGIRDLSFLKCDVEGAEWLVLSGGRDTIRRSLPYILCEIEARWSARFDRAPDDTTELLGKLGDYIPFVARKQRLRQVDPGKGGPGNYFFIPRSKLRQFLPRVDADS